jgi:predicted small metal-binding protein
MKRFRCGDVVPGCTAVFHDHTDDAILAAVAVHAREGHGLTEIPDALVAQVRSLIHDVPTAA